MADYVPLAYLVITVFGAIHCLATIAPVAPQPREPGIRMVLAERAGLNAFGYRWHTTPPGDPTIFGPLTTERYYPPTDPRRARLHTIGTFTTPPPPTREQTAA